MGLDCYRALGLPPDCSAARIHQRYRDLVLKVHPGRDQNNPDEAQTQFQELGEAYDILKNPKLRRIYDQLGYDGLTARSNCLPGHPYGYRYHRDPLRTFEEHFGTTHPYANAFEPHETAHDYHLYADIFRARKKNKLPPLIIGLEVTLEELYHGNIREVEYTKMVLNEFHETEEQKVVKDVSVRPGWTDGTQVVYENEGDQATDMLPADVLIQIVELPHERFFRDGKDLRMKIQVDLLVALCGGDITLTGIDDMPIRIEETNVIKPGSVRLIPGFGMPYEQSRGDLYLDYEVVFPDDMDLARREMVARALANQPAKAQIPVTLVAVTGCEDGSCFDAKLSDEDDTATGEPRGNFSNEDTGPYNTENPEKSGPTETNPTELQHTAAFPLESID